MKIKIVLDNRKCELIKKELNVDLKIGFPILAKKLEDGLYQLAMLKKSGVNIDFKKIAEEGMKLGDATAKEMAGKKDESAKD